LKQGLPANRWAALSFVPDSAIPLAARLSDENTLAARIRLAEAE